MRISDWSSDVCSSDLLRWHLLRYTSSSTPPSSRRAGRPGPPHEPQPRWSPPPPSPDSSWWRPRAPHSEPSSPSPALLSTTPPDRKSVVEGKSVTGRVDLGGSRIIKKKKKKTNK